MDYRIDNKDETKWVDDQLSRLSSSPDWEPDSHRAFEQLMQRNSKGVSRRQRIFMATALSAAIVLVLVLLPWRFVWKSVVQEKSTLPPTSAEGVAETAEPAIHQQTGIQAALPVPAVELRPSSSEPIQAAQVRPAEAPRIPTVPTAEGPRQGRPDGLGFVTPEEGEQPRKIVHTPGVTEPRAITQIQPAYTEEAKLVRIQGTVILSCLIKEDGTVEIREITQSLGFGLDESAVEAVKQWRFVPGFRDGQAVPVFTSISLHFTLR